MDGFCFSTLSAFSTFNPFFTIIFINHIIMNNISKTLIALLLLLTTSGIHGQNYFQRPKLVVGIVVDQMRWDYLMRYQERYSQGGFLRLMNGGYNCNRTLINYLPSVTAVGHTCIYTGSVPAITGIISNDMYVDGEDVKSVEDQAFKPVGIDGKKSASPHYLQVTTVTDELRMATNFKAKVIGVSLKDRGAILPAGHTANAAYWLDVETGRFISSTYYMQSLPAWVKDFNKKGLADQYLEKGWTFLYEEDSYVQSAPKDKEMELPVGSEIRTSPYGNTIVLDFAMEAVAHEQLGQDNIPDFLTVSLSATDHIGHRVGPNSSYMEDTYLRLDQDLAHFLDFLDQKVGKDSYMVFLTADHGGAHNLHFLDQHKIPAGYLMDDVLTDELDSIARIEFDVDYRLVKDVRVNQVFLHDDHVAKYGVDRQRLVDFLCEQLMQNKNVAYAFDLKHIPSYLPEPLKSMTANGYHPKRSGSIQIIPNPQVSNPYNYHQPEAGTAHSVWNPYDCHVPLLFYGAGIPKGWDDHTYHITDIAPTVAAILNIQQPSGCVGHVITPVLGPRNE